MNYLGGSFVWMYQTSLVTGQSMVPRACPPCLQWKARTPTYLSTNAHPWVENSIKVMLFPKHWASSDSQDALCCTLFFFCFAFFFSLVPLCCLASSSMVSYMVFLDTASCVSCTHTWPRPVLYCAALKTNQNYAKNWLGSCGVAGCSYFSLSDSQSLFCFWAFPGFSNQTETFNCIFSPQGECVCVCVCVCIYDHTQRIFSPESVCVCTTIKLLYSVWDNMAC